jgi:L,D-transpeptidase YcbB
MVWMGRRIPTLVVVSFLGALSAVSACRRTDNEASRAQPAEIQRLLNAPAADVRRDRDRAALWKTMRDLYAERKFSTIWIDGDRPARQLDALIAALSDAGSHGVDPERYDLTELAALRARADRGWLRRDRFEKSQIPRADVRSTWAWIEYAADLSAGAANAEGPADKLWRLSKQKIDFKQRLAASIENGSLAEDLQRFAPQHPEYLRLKEAYAHYLKLAAAGGWRTLPRSLTLETGDRSRFVPALAERLAAIGDFQGAPRTDDLFDADLSAAVARFQRRHGVEPDGVVGRRVVAELNVPVERRVRQIELNLERWRWLPRNLGGRYILVNLPEYRLELHEGNATPVAMNVVVGARSTPTPVFSDTLTHVVFSPYWNVPDSIASGETLPAVQADPGFLTRNGIEVVGTSGQVVDAASIDWSSLSTDGEEPDKLPYRFRQRPGSSNSLGLVKFVFPNQYDVYLHDTPADALFARAYRAMSHGCVRLEQPEALAEYLLKDRPGWTLDDIRAAMHAGQEKHVKLSRPIPVHLTYWTVRVAADGTVHFRDDVYERDARELSTLRADVRLRPGAPRAGG